MTELDRLPPDQRAVLSLVLNRGKSYGEVADMLAIPESAVRDRAHAALDALAAAAPDVSAQYSASSASAAAGASAARSADPLAARPARSARGGARSPRPDAPARSSAVRGSLSPPSSKLGGALLLGAIVVVIVVAVVLISSGGGKGSSHATTSTTSSTPATSTASAGKTKLDATVTLTPAEPGLKASGKTFILSQGKQRAFYISAQNLPPSSGFFYAVWLYNSPSSSTPLGRAPTVSSNGRMEGGGPLPTNASSYHQLIVTRETSTHPSAPGPMVMTGNFSLH